MRHPEGINRFEEDNTVLISSGHEEALMIGFFPWPESEDDTAWVRHYAAVAYSYNAVVNIVWTPEQVYDEMLRDGFTTVAIEEFGGREDGVSIVDFVHPEKCLYVVGNSHYRFPSDHFMVDSSVFINTPGGYAHPLYGSQALSIVMHDRVTKSLRQSSAADNSGPPE